MKRNGRLLLAGVVTALAMLTVPALAQAAVWKHKGVTLAKFAEINLTGGEIFETSAGNGMSCEVHATLTTEGGSTGKVTKFEIKKCPTGFGTFAKCEVVTAEPKGLPWTVKVNTSDLTITNLHTKRTFKNCATTELDKTIESTKVTLNTPTAITEMEFSGSTTGFSTVGSFTVDSPNSGLYGIG
jgi:CxxC motif-containing protein